MKFFLYENPLAVVRAIAKKRETKETGDMVKQ